MSFTDHLLLWLHVGFAIFTLGPVTAAMMATPRYIRARDLTVLRYLYRSTRIFGAATLGVFLFGLVLGRRDFNQAWLSASITLFIVAAVLLVLVFRDQSRAISAIEKMVTARDAAKAPVPTNPVPTSSVPTSPVAAGGASAEATTSAATGADETGGTGGTSEAGQARGAGQASGTDALGRAAAPAHLASVERGRIASMAGVITAIWLVILILMVWHG